ncbi:hypothetical protein T440DRAFT_466872 [Plenodomus tracheiphilus IPT5]|uniref:Uncharacterized protein n=1 Tax=Plenodomus tracheiphilus IPT5 TaxID=1408161 RepID=A0A6A7BCI9_9PLEO|nr:hypothetical protein T440DRAFT_466872 [Plenodomus tracheiphilus IPT5]
MACLFHQFLSCSCLDASCILQRTFLPNPGSSATITDASDMLKSIKTQPRGRQSNSCIILRSSPLDSTTKFTGSGAFAGSTLL